MTLLAEHQAGKHDQKDHGRRGSSAESVGELKDIINSRHNIDQLQIAEFDTSIELANIRVNPESRGKGVGSDILDDIKGYATKVGKPIVLTIEADPGRKADLEKFYKQNDFVRPGGAKDFSLRQHSHVWNPPEVKESVRESILSHLTISQCKRLAVHLLWSDVEGNEYP